jgi:hypothetical protein
MKIKIHKQPSLEMKIERQLLDEIQIKKKVYEPVVAVL